MIELTRGFTKARIWLDNLPDFCFSPAEVLEQVFVSHDTYLVETRRAAMELLVPHGGYASYGTLGAEFTPNTSGYLLLRIALSPTIPALWSKYDIRNYVSKPLALHLDATYIGLTRECSEGILAAATNGVLPLGSGTLYFHCGVYELVGSSAKIFETLTSYLLQLLTLSTTITEEEAAKTIVF